MCIGLLLKPTVLPIRFGSVSQWIVQCMDMKIIRTHNLSPFGLSLCNVHMHFQFGVRHFNGMKSWCAHINRIWIVLSGRCDDSKSMQSIINTVLLCDLDKNKQDCRLLLQIEILLCLLFANFPFRISIAAHAHSTSSRKCLFGQSWKIRIYFEHVCTDSSHLNQSHRPFIFIRRFI